VASTVTTNQLDVSTLTGSTLTATTLNASGPISLGTRLQGSVDGSNHFWTSLQGTATEVDRVAIGINGNVSTGMVNSILFNTSSINRMTVNSSGNVGIGTGSDINSRLVVMNQTSTGISNMGIMKIMRGPNGVGEDRFWLGFSHGTDSSDTGDRTRIGTYVQSDGKGHLYFTTGSGGSQAERMRINGDGNVGIGITNPATKFHIVDGSASSNGVIRLQNPSNAGTNYGFEIQAKNFNSALDTVLDLGKIGFYRRNNASDYSSYLSFFLSDISVTPTLSERMRIAADGNVGIGTTDPTARVHVTGISSVFDGQNSSTGEHRLIISKSAVDKVASVIFTRGGNAVSNGIAEIGLASNDALSFKVNTTPGTYTEHMRILQNGRVGIGVTNPSTKLDVNGNLTIMRSRLNFAINDDWNHSIYNNYYNIDGEGIWDGLKMNVFSGLWVRVGNASGATPTTSLFVNSSGRVGIGVTNPIGLLCLNGSPASNCVLRIQCFNDGTGGNGYNQDAIACHPLIDGNYIIAFFNTSNVLRGVIQGVNSSSVVYSTTSDRRLKSDIHGIQGALDIVKRLNPVHFKWTADNEYDFGFIAQDVYQVLPFMRPNFSSYLSNCTCTRIDIVNGILCDHCISMNDEPVNDDGTPRYYGLDYGKFTPYLVGAVKELSAENVALKEEISSLKTTVTEKVAQIQALQSNLDALLVWARAQGFSS
jgi:hypothetical protein